MYANHHAMIFNTNRIGFRKQEILCSLVTISVYLKSRAIPQKVGKMRYMILESGSSAVNMRSAILVVGKPLAQKI